MHKHSAVIFALALTTVISVAARPGQTGEAGAAPSAKTAGAGKPAGAPAPEGYTYRADGRRDPFTSLLGVTSAVHEPRTGHGPASVSVNDVAVRGIVESGGALVAMVQAPDKKTYIMRPGDKFADGAIKAITTQAIVVVQDVNEPPAPARQREVRKSLRSTEDSKK